MIGLEQMKRDREAGTPGPWYRSRYAELTICADENSIASIGWSKSFGDPAKHHTRKLSDAARIARVPEMEERILSDADEIARLRTALAALDKLMESPTEVCND